MFCMYCYFNESNGVNQFNNTIDNERRPNLNSSTINTNQLIQQSAHHHNQSSDHQHNDQQSNISRSTLSLLQEQSDKFGKMNETQSPGRRSLIETLRNNLHLKCLILTLLTGTCFLAIFCCSFATFTKILINLHSFALSRKHNAACDQAYLYIPGVFVVAFYLLYLIECFHSETRFSLKHMEPSIQIINEIEKLKESLPVIWWKSLNYHYLRRTRLITRYRNGEAYSTSQVYFQRINSRITSTCYAYDLNDGFEGNTVTDISKRVVNIDKFPLTRIRLSKGFAFANLQAANEFERQRNMFFSSSEQLDDFLEMREGMDLISSRFRDNMLCCSAKKPWYVSQKAFWLFSFLLLSWPYRILINWNTGVLNYQIIKLFGNNSTNSDTINGADSLEDRSDFNSSVELLGGHCNLPPSYSIAMLYPPNYSYIKQMFYEQADTNLNHNGTSMDNDNFNYVLDRFDKYQQHGSMVEQSGKQANSTTTTTATINDQPQQYSNDQTKTRIPSSLSCSFLNGQIVYVVNTLKSTTTTLNHSTMDNAMHCGTSLDVKDTMTDCSQLLNTNSRVQILSAGDLHETENNITFQIDSLNHALIVDEEDENKIDKLKLLTSSSNLMLNSLRRNNHSIPRSRTSENISYSYFKRFSIRILRRIKSMQNLAAGQQRSLSDVTV